MTEPMRPPIHAPRRRSSSWRSSWPACTPALASCAWAGWWVAPRQPPPPGRGSPNQPPTRALEPWALAPRPRSPLAAAPLHTRPRDISASSPRYSHHPPPAPPLKPQIRFLSHSVITGFTSGAAFIIATSQLKYILGISVPRKDTLHEQLKTLNDAIGDFVWQVGGPS